MEERKGIPFEIHMEEMLGTLIKMVGENNSRLRTLEEKSDKAGVDIHDIKENVKELMQGQERQDRILECFRSNPLKRTHTFVILNEKCSEAHSSNNEWAFIFDRKKHS